MTELVPLPDYMSECSCPGKPRRHRSDCATLDRWHVGRRDMEKGKRYAAPTVDFPVSMTVDCEIMFQLDPARWFGEDPSRLDDYLAFDQGPGYAPWERPISFWTRMLEEDLDLSVPMLGYLVGIVSANFDWQYGVTAPWAKSRWTEEDTLALHRELGLNEVGDDRVDPPDPNQGSLL